jgi:catalase
LICYRERIPERVVHAKGAGAHGYFEVTKDVSKYTKAHFLGSVGRQTPLFLRFSTVAGERGYADTDRDPRGFAIKFYTEEGNYDMVGNNTPVFFIRDPIKFHDFIHTQKRDPKTGLRHSQAAWDFWTQTPEAFHQLTILFSDRGTPDGFRHMNGYSSHTYKWINEAGDVHYVQYHFKTNQGIKNLTAEKAAELKSTNPDYATQDLHDAIESGDNPSWTFYVQIMPEADAENYRFDILDITKVWPHADYPLHEVGRMVLNRNPENFFAETEQSAFAPTHTVPGIEPSNDRMLQGRLFSYPDTHRHRLGANYDHIPINCPYRARVANYQRDGPMMVTSNGGSSANYEPNTVGGPVQDESKAWSHPKVEGTVGRHSFGEPDDFCQPRALYKKVMTEADRVNLIKNTAAHMKGVSKDLLEKAVKIYWKIDPDYGERIAKAVGVAAPIRAKM